MTRLIDFAVVPVAGQGTRLLPSTKSQPKEMLPVGRKPVVQYVVEELAEAGIGRLLFVTGPGKTSIENHFDVNPELIAYLRETGREELLEELEFERKVPEYYYTRQRRQLGLGHAVLCAESLVGRQPFVVALGDTILGLQQRSDIVRRMVEQFTRLKADAMIALAEVPGDEVQQYGIASIWDQGSGINEQTAEPVLLADVVEKPAVDEAPSRWSVAARYVLSPKVFDFLRELDPGADGEIELTDAVRRMIRAGGNVYGMCLTPEEQRYDVGNFESYFRAFVEFALADARYGAGLREQLKNM